MAGTAFRDLVVRIVGDAKQMTAASKEAESGIAGFENRLGKVQSALAAAFAGGAMIAFAKASTQAALEDSRAQERLAKTLENVVGANDAVKASVEKSIAGMERQFAVADDELRPAFETLVRATKDVGQAQSMMQLALDVSAGSGRSLQDVSVALVKAMGGQMRGLKDLGIQVKTTSGDTASFADVQKQLNVMFGGQAAEAADSQTGRLKAMQISYENLKESVGRALLPVMMQLANVAAKLFGWFNRLDEGTQKTIVQIGIFGGVAYTAVKAINALRDAFSGLSVTAVNTKTSIGSAAVSLGLLSALIADMNTEFDDSKSSSDAYVAAIQAQASGAKDAAKAEVLRALSTGKAKKALDESNLTLAQATNYVLGYTDELGNSEDQIYKVYRGTLVMLDEFLKQQRKTYNESIAKADELRQANEKVGQSVAGLQGPLSGTITAEEARKQALNRTTAAADKHNNILEEMLRIEDLTGRGAKEMADRIDQAAKTIRGTLDARYELTQATKDYQDALAGLSKNIKEAGGDELALQLVYDDAVSKALKVAESITTISGATLDARGKNDLFVQSLVNMRNQASDPQLQEALDLLIRQLMTLSGLTYNSSFDPNSMQLPGYPKVKGKRAAGGPVSMGSAYLVGERGPEVFVPAQSGTIVPNGASPSGISVVINTVAGDPLAIERVVLDAIGRASRRGMTALVP